MAGFLAYGSNTPPPGLGGKGFFGAKATSSNPGDTWTQLITGFEGTLAPFARQISFVNGNFIITTAGTDVLFSSDTVTWTLNFVNGFSQGTAVGFGAGTYALSISDASLTSPRIFSSPDLATWTGNLSNLPAGALGSQSSAPVFGNSVWLIVSLNSANYATSPDALAWTARNTYAPQVWGQPIFDGTQFVAAVVNGSGNPKIATSTDGINWTESTVTLSAAFSSGSTPFSVGNRGTAQYLAGESADDTGQSLNTAFTTATSFTYNNTGFGTLVSPVYSGASWARINRGSAGNAALQSSSNGLAWNQDTIPAGFRQSVGVAFGLGKFLALGHDASNHLFVITRGP